MTKIDEIMERQVTRRQFLAILGAGILGLLGVSSLLGIFSGQTQSNDSPADYGMRDYGP